MWQCERGSQWTPKDRKNKTEIARHYIKRYEGDMNTERKCTSQKNLENENLMYQIGKGTKKRMESEDLTRRMVAASCHLSVHKSVSCFTCHNTQLSC